MNFTKDYTHGFRSLIFPHNRIKNRFVLFCMGIVTLFAFTTNIGSPANASELLNYEQYQPIDIYKDAQTLVTGDYESPAIHIERSEVEVLPPPPPEPVAPPQPRPAPNAAVVGEAQAYARTLVANDAEWNCLYSLWQRESGWRVEAYNASSGATGIPQALPGSKMASAGADWATNYVTQVNWGMGYINGRYGSPCNAWAHSEAKGWY